MSEISLDQLAKEFAEFKSKKKSKHYPDRLKEQALQLAKSGVPYFYSLTEVANFARRYILTARAL